MLRALVSANRVTGPIGTGGCILQFVPYESDLHWATAEQFPKLRPNCRMADDSPRTGDAALRQKGRYAPT